MSEVFSVGEAVTYTDALRRKFLECKIVKVMPQEHAAAVRHYRIRATAEPFERSVPGFTLTRTDATEAVFKV